MDHYPLWLVLMSKHVCAEIEENEPLWWQSEHLSVCLSTCLHVLFLLLYCPALCFFVFWSVVDNILLHADQVMRINKKKARAFFPILFVWCNLSLSLSHTHTHIFIPFIQTITYFFTPFYTNNHIFFSLSLSIWKYFAPPLYTDFFSAHLTFIIIFLSAWNQEPPLKLLYFKPFSSVGSSRMMELCLEH